MIFSALLATSLLAAPIDVAKSELAQAENSSTLSAELKAAEVGRLSYWLAQYLPDEDSAKAVLEKALARLEKENAENSQSAELLVAWIAVKGELAQHKSKLAALGTIKPLQRAALRLKEVDPKFRNFAADRILGRLYHLAPSFISIGSRTKAREHFEMALAGSPQFPENLLFYAEFLHSIGEKDRAISMCKQAISSPMLAEFALERDYWERLGKKYLEEWTERKS